MAISLAVIIGKTTACTLGAFVAGHERQTCLRAGLGMAVIGEFSFVIAGLGQQLKVTSGTLYPIAVCVCAITTLATPYRIRSADWMVKKFDELAPKPLHDFLDFYTQWVGYMSAHHGANLAMRLIRKWVALMLVNIALIAGVFIAASFVARTEPEWLARFVSQNMVRAVLWFSAMMVALPLLIANYRKLEALAMLLAELSTRRTEGELRREVVQSVVSRVILVVGTVGHGLWLVVLSSALIPSWKVFLLLLVVIGVLGWLAWNSFIKLYHRAQISLEQTFEDGPDSADHHAPPPPAPVLPDLLKDAKLEMVAIEEGSLVTHKTLRELALRTKTGASIVAIGRGTSTYVNPGPDDELQPGDRVMLLGAPGQLKAALSYFQTDGVEPVNGEKHG